MIYWNKWKNDKRRFFENRDIWIIERNEIIVNDESLKIEIYDLLE
jgi:hypothetical protein